MKTYTITLHQLLDIKAALDALDRLNVSEDEKIELNDAYLAFDTVIDYQEEIKQ